MRTWWCANAKVLTFNAKFRNSSFDWKHDSLGTLYNSLPDVHQMTCVTWLEYDRALNTRCTVLCRHPPQRTHPIVLRPCCDPASRPSEAVAAKTTSWSHFQLFTRMRNNVVFWYERFLVSISQIKFVYYCCSVDLTLLTFYKKNTCWSVID